MAVRTAIKPSEALTQRVNARVAALPPVHMTAMQTMATFLWRPLALMGILMLASGAIIAGVSSFRVDEFFGLAQPDLGAEATFTSIQTWLPGYQFMGMGFLFAAITMVVASLLGRLRILGGTVQTSLGAQVRFPPFPMTARIFPLLMLLGLMVFMAQLGVSAWLATEAKSGDLLTVATHADWLQGMRIAGVGIMLAGIALALFTITGLMRFMARRVSEVAIQAIEADS